MTAPWSREPAYDRVALIEAAAGRRELDLVLRGVTVVNVFTGETYPADLGIFAGRIAHVTAPGDPVCAGPGGGPLAGRTVLDRRGLVAIPGLIDTHVHIESSMITPAHYADAVLPHGTTSVLIDPHELANVLGLPGVRYMLDASEDIPLRVLVMAPSCVPSAPAVETAGAAFDRAEIEEMLGWPRVVGLAEVMDYPGVLRGEGRMMRLLEATERAGGLIQGHAPRVRGRNLSAYAAAGIDSDHENRETQDGLAKLRTGMYLEVRESSLSPNAAALAAALRGRGYLPNVTLCTDDVVPEDLLGRGGVDYVARRLVEEGLDPIDVVRFATLNAANRLRRHDLGALTPGRIADVVLLSNLPRFQAAEVYRAGRRVAEDGRVIAASASAPPNRTAAVERENTIRLPRDLAAGVFRIRVSGTPDGEATIRVIDFNGRSAPVRTTYGTMRVRVAGGEVALPPSADGRELAMLAVVERHGRHGGTACAVIRGFGPREGAIATSVSHDSHNLTIVGTNPEDMLFACRTLAESGGGIVLVRGGRVTARIDLPVAGLISLKPAADVAAEVAAFRTAAEAAGMAGERAFMAIVSLTLAVSPEGKLSDLGLVDVERQTLLPAVIEAP
ncbi:MAG TPA: adenine deaminase C-terminal domain-containing protein [bacterium]|nr:adenine deaminase C-terminal domain-containing protein [bacterium]